MDHAQDLVWLSPPEHLCLDRHRIHVWRASLTLSTPHLLSLQHTLSTDERIRAERYHFPIHREHFIAARGLLRVLLGRYLGQDPRQLRFRYSAHGKPALAGGSELGRICFNVSHSHGLALYAVTCDREVGIDLEQIRYDLDDTRVAERFFAAGETEALRALPANMRTEEFFTYWTCKEAYIKARGTGLSLPLDQFEVSIAPREQVATVTIIEAVEEDAKWLVRTLAPQPGYAGALAAEGHDWEFTCWQWPEG